MHLLRIIKCSIIIYNAHLKKKYFDSLDYAMRGGAKTWALAVGLNTTFYQ